MVRAMANELGDDLGHWGMKGGKESVLPAPSMLHKIVKNAKESENAIL